MILCICYGENMRFVWLLGFFVVLVVCVLFEFFVVGCDVCIVMSDFGGICCYFGDVIGSCGNFLIGGFIFDVMFEIGVCNDLKICVVVFGGNVVVLFM